MLYGARSSLWTFKFIICIFHQRILKSTFPAFIRVRNSNKLMTKNLYACYEWIIFLSITQYTSCE